PDGGLRHSTERRAGLDIALRHSSRFDHAAQQRGSYSAPGDKVQVVDLFHLELPQPGRDQLSANFIDGVGSVKGRCKVTLEHRRRVLRVLVHQPDNGLGIRRAYKIDQQHWRARLRASRGGSPKLDGVREMMKK